jgi:putative spermidine/putrescine transport system ATP-binding protein
MQLEVRRLQRRLGLTTIFITHDQEEALVLSDRIAVMNKGSIQQIAGTTEIYERPASGFVADFVGESNILRGTANADGTISLEGGGSVRTARPLQAGRQLGILMRPERFTPTTNNSFTGEVIEAVYLGSSFKVRLKTAGRELIVRQPARGKLPQPGERLSVGIEPDEIHVFDL